MAFSRRLLSRHPALAVLTPLPLDTVNDPVLAYRWLLEVWLVRVRWFSLLLFLLAVPFAFGALTISWPVPVLLALGLGLGNAWLGRALASEPTPGQLRLIRGLATGLDWGLGLAVLGFSAGSPVHDTLPALLLLLMLATGWRYGATGLLSATVGTALLTAILVGLHVAVWGELGAAEGAWLLAGWEFLIALTALLGVGLQRAGHDCFRWEKARVAIQDAAIQRMEYGLSQREWAVLRLLAEELSYGEIAAILYISPATVKVHTRHIGVKLGVTGRWQVVLAARQLRLLSDEPELSSPRVGPR